MVVQPNRRRILYLPPDSGSEDVVYLCQGKSEDKSFRSLVVWTPEGRLQHSDKAMAYAYTNLPDSLVHQVESALSIPSMLLPVNLSKIPVLQVLEQFPDGVDFSKLLSQRTASSWQSPTLRHIRPEQYESLSIEEQAQYLRIRAPSPNRIPAVLFSVINQLKQCHIAGDTPIHGPWWENIGLPDTKGRCLLPSCLEHAHTGQECLFDLSHFYPELSGAKRTQLWVGFVSLWTGQNGPPELDTLNALLFIPLSTTALRKRNATLRKMPQKAVEQSTGAADPGSTATGALVSSERTSEAGRVSPISEDDVVVLTERPISATKRPLEDNKHSSAKRPCAGDWAAGRTGSGSTSGGKLDRYIEEASREVEQLEKLDSLLQRKEELRRKLGNFLKD